jgi:rod shape-determining protein MreC
MRNLPFKRLTMAIGFFAIFCLGIMLMDSRSLLDPLRSGLGVVLNPIITELQAIGQPADPSDPVEVQLATAEAERDALRAENMLLQGQLDEQAVLLQTMQIQSDYTDREVLPARVLGTDPSGLQQKIIINRGSADGVREGMAVIDGTHFIGQVVDVEENRSSVLLITDANASVGARMYNSRADGILYGNGRANPNLTLRHINRAVTPVENEWIMTSDLFESETAQVPGNIPIGWIVGEPTVNAQTDQIEFTVQPAADFDNLENVWIVVPQ